MLMTGTVWMLLTGLFSCYSAESQFDEMASFIEGFLKEMPEDIQRLIIYRNIPTCEDLFKDKLKGLKNPDNDKNSIA